MYEVQSYDSIVRQSYKFDQSFYDHSEAYAILKALYNRNYLLTSGPDAIPKMIHQIWLGSEIPEQYKVWGETWKKFHPTWTYKLWTDKDVAEFGMVNQKPFNQSQNVGQKSDIFRQEILFRYGGLYVDTDFECLKPFDDLLYLDYFTSSGYAPDLELYIGLIGSIPNHGITKRSIFDMKFVPTKNYKDMYHTTGSYFYSRCVIKELSKNTQGVVVFPPKFFYPWPNHKKANDDPYSYVKSYSYAIHHWEVSWAKKRDNGLDSGK